jgi:hypothetical protein
MSETLIEGERVTYEAKLHWIIFVAHPVLAYF